MPSTEYGYDSGDIRLAYPSCTHMFQLIISFLFLFIVSVVAAAVAVLLSCQAQGQPSKIYEMGHFC